MRQEAVRERNRRSTFFSFPFTSGAAVEDATIQIDPSLALRLFQGGRTDGRRSRPSVEPDQDKSRHMAAGPTVGRLAFLYFPVAPRCQQKPRGFRSRHPTFAGDGFIR